MKKILSTALLLLIAAIPARAQKNQGSIKVSPNGVNVNANGATSVFLTYGGMTSKYRPAEAAWCGELISAAPDIGLKCDPATIYGYLPERFNLSSPTGRRGMTDVLSVPASIARRAYQDAQAGADSAFYYVRRFASAEGPDEYVVVTCRMAGGGVMTPLTLTGVKLGFVEDQSRSEMLVVKSGEKLPPIKADLIYTGTGRLIGRWEVISPGDEFPADRDLMTEAALPGEERGRQRRYLMIQRFNLFLPPTGQYTLTLDDTSRLPALIEGAYQVLLRIEVSEDQDGGVNLTAAGAGAGFMQTGAVAGFALPVLRYYVGSGDRPSGPAVPASPAFSLLSPAEAETIAAKRDIVFSWSEAAQAAFYRLEVRSAETEAAVILSVIQRKGNKIYRAPSWIKEKAAGGKLRWRVVVLDQAGTVLGESGWRALQLQ